MPRLPSLVLTSLMATQLLACATKPTPITPVPQVDLPRYMGDWYVIAHIPSFVERHAYDAVESYQLNADGTVQTTFRYRNGSFDAPVQTMHPTGFPHAEQGNAEWGMQFLWPIKAQYLIGYLDADYRETVVVRDARDYAWIMARTPTIPDSDYQRLVAKLQQWGYAIDQLRRVPQSERGSTH